MIDSKYKIGVATTAVALIGYIFASYRLGIYEAAGTLISVIIIVFSGYLFNKGTKRMRIIGTILNLYLIFLFFMPKYIKTGINELKERELSDDL